MTVAQVWSQDQIVTTFLKRALCNIHETRFVGFAPARESFGYVGLLQDGYRVSVVFLKLFEKIYAPLTAGLQHPFSGDANLPDNRISNLDKLYLGVSAALDNLLDAVGLEAA